MSDDLKSCPFCGSYDLGSGGDDKVVGYWCKRCEATGPNQYGRYEWNSRADRIEELEAKLAKAVGCLVRLYYGAGVVTDDMHATLAELKGQDDE